MDGVGGGGGVGIDVLVFNFVGGMIFNSFFLILLNGNGII